jgi:hypothetical protein
LQLFWDQSWKIVLALVVFAFLLPAAKRVVHLKRADWIRVGLILLFPFVMLLKRKLTIPFTHYPFPFLMMTFVALGFYLARVRRWSWSANPWSAALPLVAMFVTVGTTPKILNAQLHAQFKCRPENRILHSKMVQWGQEGNKIWIDPYVPYDTGLSPDRQDVGWSKSWRQADADGYNLFALNTEYYSKFLGDGEPTEYTRIEIPGWRDARDFYRSFAGQEKAVSPSGRKFIKIYTDTCFHEVWKEEK